MRIMIRARSLAAAPACMHIVVVEVPLAGKQRAVASIGIILGIESEMGAPRQKWRISRVARKINK